MIDAMIRLSVSLSRSSVSLAEDWFWEQGSVATTTGDGNEGLQRITALFAAGQSRDLEAALRDWLQRESVAFENLSSETVDPGAWRVARREAFRSMNVGRIWLISETEPNPPETAADDLVIRIYPDHAFGSGEHATTRSMLLGMQSCELIGKTILDVGCGTGVLAIAAEKLGARSCDGFDIDPECEPDMLHHVRSNRAQRTNLWIGSWDSIPRKTYDWVLANVTLNVHRDMVSGLDGWLGSDGVVLGAGIQDWQWEDTRRCYAEAGWAISVLSLEETWVCFEGRRF